MTTTCLERGLGSHDADEQPTEQYAGQDCGAVEPHEHQEEQRVNHPHASHLLRLHTHAHDVAEENHAEHRRPDQHQTQEQRVPCLRPDTHSLFLSLFLYRSKEVFATRAFAGDICTLDDRQGRHRHRRCTAVGLQNRMVARRNTV
ncbi:hypothetical protein B484DRAFT_105842 [Ochromonadaceae sp. CCMP2298]|nr:hypothetical protein B484DRAFT_105842 [Ochromonadaceae sp. CCMP2298]